MQKPNIDKELSSYEGRWVARVRGKIVAQGHTAEEAELSARQTRPKDKVEIMFVPNSENLIESPLLSAIKESLSPDQEIYLVGGAVRDFLLKRETHDLDFVVPSDGIKTAKKVAKALGGDFFPLDKKTDVGRVILKEETKPWTVLDFASFRAGDLKSDLSARDFSINAIAYNLQSNQYNDPVGGSGDIRAGIIRACSESAFTDDPIRIIRAIRFANSLGFSIQKETQKLIKESTGLLVNSSPERLRDELFKVLEGPKPSSAIKTLDLVGALPCVLPELLETKGVKQPHPHTLDVWEHTLKALDHLESIFGVLAVNFDSEKANDLLTGLLTSKLGRYRKYIDAHFNSRLVPERSLRALLCFATLYHDIAKPVKHKVVDDQIQFHGHEEDGSRMAVKRAIKLRLSNAEMDRVKVIVRNHMRLIQHFQRHEIEGKIPARRAIYRFFQDTGDAGIDLCLLALSDQRATYGHEITQQKWSACLDIVRIFMENWWENREDTVSPPILLTGDDIMAALKLKQGPEIGKLLGVIREAQAVGNVHTREEALKLVESWLAERQTEKAK